MDNIGYNKNMLSVLVIEDNKEFRLLLRDLLEEAGCRVVEAEDGKEGFDIAEKNDFDLVITDILMPNQEGIETIIGLKKLNPLSKIVAISGGGATQNMTFLELAKKLGAYRTLQKPFGLNVIEEIIFELTSKN
ncbi:response regulator [Cohaesibacter celericrescens]|uniref:Response regulator n=1 Tax=Cohaesibacter celericrescens TaxID=2067669 RepID=A0A2N5XXK0_9HYPH|nr:response regulator [Cohaesibacter celericrescens]PLW79197.1 response regulator [Cohaesibacter celericrescens]